MEQVIRSAKVKFARQVGRVARAAGVSNCENKIQRAINSVSTSLGVGLSHTTVKSKDRVDGVTRVQSDLLVEPSSYRPALELSRGFYASPHFLGRFGRPADPKDLKSGQFMFYKRGSESTAVVVRNTLSGCRSVLSFGVPAEGTCAAALVKAAVRGLGVVFVPHHIAEPALHAHELVQIMHEWGSS
jgi:DNA-binding transcriptional LysR family regulator